MERGRGQKQGTTDGFKVVRLMILAIICGQAELSARPRQKVCGPRRQLLR